MGQSLGGSASRSDARCRTRRFEPGMGSPITLRQAAVRLLIGPSVPGRPLWAGTAEPWKTSWRHEASCFVAVLQLQPVIIPVKLFILCIFGLTNRFQKNRGIRRVELERFRLLSEFNDTIQGAMVRRLVNKASQERRRPLVKPSSVEEGSELEEILAQGQDVWIRAANTGARRTRSGFSNRGSHSRKRD